MNKKALTEADIRSKFITPAIVGESGAGWDLMTQVLEEHYFTRGRVIVRGKTTLRGEAKKADYILFYKPNIPLAVIEAKDNKHTVGAGMQQALEYAEILDVPFAYSSNGDAFLEHDRTATGGPVTREIPLGQFPSPEELWARYRAAKGYTPEQEKVATQSYFEDGSQKAPRYYQLVAINRTVDAIARGEKRILLVMATGTGKTYTAFQIIWRLWKSGAKKRILFLVDRNILADQIKTNDFKPFGKSMTKISHRTVNKDYSIYLGLYQALTGPEEEQNIYKQFPPDFFDLVIVDECHRGSADEDAAWRRVLDYFSSATQIGLTATPKETKTVSNIGYFGVPVYTYPMRQGISDGFLAPYKVIRIDLDKEISKDGLEDPEYSAFRKIIPERRIRVVAAKITEFLKAINRFAKTIVFCENIDHAERMRQALVNANSDLATANANYVMRITSDVDNEGRIELGNFVDPDSTYPVIICTSRMMTTVDAPTCHLIVLDRPISSIAEFKQIIGRGTSIDEEYGKLFFTIMDFRRATDLFADPAFDGDPVQIYEPRPYESPVPPTDRLDPDKDYPPGEDTAALTTKSQGSDKHHVDDVEVTFATERVQNLDSHGKLISEPLKAYTRRIVRTAYKSMDTFLVAWNQTERKETLLEELAAQGVILDDLAEQVGRDYDAFDLICHVAFDAPPLTRKERAEKVSKRKVFAKYGDKARSVLGELLLKYTESGITNLESLEILKVEPLTSFGTPVEIIKVFGGKPSYLNAIRELETALYQETT